MIIHSIKLSILLSNNILLLIMNKHQQDLDNITLQFFANSLYNINLEKTDSSFSLQEKKFYKKRIISLTKQMLKENYPTKALQNIHTNYINEIIDYIKQTDTNDILQENYKNIDKNKNNNKDKDKDTNTNISNNKDTTSIDITNTTVSMFKQNKIDKNRIVTLDNFVKHLSNKLDPNLENIPRIRNINIKTEAHKIKGLVKKK